VRLALLAAMALPGGITVIAPNETLPATPSPDGRNYAFWDNDTVVVHSAAEAPVWRIRASTPSTTCDELAWSPSGKDLAFSSDAGLQVLDVAAGKTRVVDPAPSCLFAFRNDGTLHYLKSSGLTATLWKEGSLTFITRLPMGNEYRMSHTAIAGAKMDPQTKVLPEVWAVDFSEYRARTIFTGKAYDFVAGDERVCVDVAPHGTCTDVRTGAKSDITPPSVALKSIRVWEEDLSFSPSGRFLAFVGADDQLYVRDFSSGSVRALAHFPDRSTYSFVDERTVIYADDPGTTAVDVASGAHRLLIPYGFVFPRALPGRTDVLLFGYDHGKTRDLVRWSHRYTP